MEEGLWDLVRVKDIASSNVISLTPQESLFDVLIKFGYKNVAVLPVISDLQSRKLIGLIHRKEVLEAYQRRIVSSIRKE